MLPYNSRSLLSFKSSHKITWPFIAYSADVKVARSDAILMTEMARRITYTNNSDQLIAILYQATVGGQL